MTKQTDAANKLEDLFEPMKVMVIALRDGHLPDRQAYALLYELRYRVGLALAPLGVGLPERQYRASTIALFADLQQDGTT